MAIIQGDPRSRIVTINGKILSPARSQAIRNHSPDGFAWGYCGSGPAQLSLALLLEFTDEKTAQRFYQDFKQDVIAGIKQDIKFEMDSDFIIDWIQKRRSCEKIQDKPL